MNLSIAPTPAFETVEGRPCRVWVGVTPDGIPVKLWIAAIEAATDDRKELAVFDRELRALPKMERQLVSFDLRMVT